jgi:hypothetical protein
MIEVPILTRLAAAARYARIARGSSERRYASGSEPSAVAG